jgi:cytochrome o ubiquinol oxidase operon protein cyoD
MTHERPYDEPDVPFYQRRPLLSDYFTGFFTAVALTSVPFWVVAAGDINRGDAMVLIAAFALIQMMAQLRFFLHYSTKRVPVEATVALALAIGIGGIIIAGAVWVMYDLNYRMMG